MGGYRQKFVFGLVQAALFGDVAEHHHRAIAPLFAFGGSQQRATQRRTTETQHNITILIAAHQQPIIAEHFARQRPRKRQLSRFEHFALQCAGFFIAVVGQGWQRRQSQQRGGGFIGQNQLAKSIANRHAISDGLDHGAEALPFALTFFIQARVCHRNADLRTNRHQRRPIHRRRQRRQRPVQNQYADNRAARQQWQRRPPQQFCVIAAIGGQHWTHGRLAVINHIFQQQIGLRGTEQHRFAGRQRLADGQHNALFAGRNQANCAAAGSNIFH